MTAKLHLAPGMCRGCSQTSEHQTALSSVNLIALDMGFIGSHGPKEKRGAKAEPDFLPRISFSFVSQARIRMLRRKGLSCCYVRITGLKGLKVGKKKKKNIKHKITMHRGGK